MKGVPCVRWSAFELDQLRRMIAERRGPREISSALGRSAAAVEIKAYGLGLKFANPKFGQIARSSDIAAWSDADKISEWARVPQALADLLVTRAAEAKESLKEIRSDNRLKRLVEFRKAFSVEAAAMGYNTSEIGRALNRDHTTIIYAIKSSERRMFWHSDERVAA